MFTHALRQPIEKNTGCNPTLNISWHAGGGRKARKCLREFLVVELVHLEVQQELLQQPPLELMKLGIRQLHMVKLHMVSCKELHKGLGNNLFLGSKI